MLSSSTDDVKFLCNFSISKKFDGSILMKTLYLIIDCNQTKTETNKENKEAIPCFYYFRCVYHISRVIINGIWQRKSTKLTECCQIPIHYEMSLIPIVQTWFDQWEKIMQLLYWFYPFRCSHFFTVNFKLISNRTQFSKYYSFQFFTHSIVHELNVCCGFEWFSDSINMNCHFSDSNSSKRFSHSIVHSDT